VGSRTWHDPTFGAATTASTAVNRAIGPLRETDDSAVYSSPWLLELFADGGSPPPATAVRSGSFTHPQLRRAGAAGGTGTLRRSTSPSAPDLGVVLGEEMAEARGRPHLGVGQVVDDLADGSGVRLGAGHRRRRPDL
jgi:hypothetical protein